MVQSFWYENVDGQGNYGSQQIISLSGSVVNNLSVNDLDNDGDMDVVCLSNNANEIFWFENTDGQESFSNEQSITNNVNDIFYAMGDINGDGLIDIVSTTNDNKLIWHQNLGNEGNEISGNVHIDVNNNGCDINDIPFNNIMVIASDGSNNSYASFTDSLGNYQINTGLGDFETSISTTLPPYYTSNPSSYNTSFANTGNSENLDFCISPVAETDNLNISFYPLNEARPGFEAQYQIVYKNTGTTTLSGTISLDFDDSKMSFTNASESLLSQTVNNISFEYLNLTPFEERTIDVAFTIAQPPTTNNDDVVSFTATIDPIENDYSEDDNVFVFNQILVGSYDPNDIQVLEGPEITEDDIDKYLHYIIRFQNTGTASAINVRVTNVLDDYLDWTSLQLENTSHDNVVNITDGNFVEFMFNNIHLPDSTSNEPASHGYIQYKIKPIPSIEIGNSIFNEANIYFDFNLPIETNTASTTVTRALSIDDNNENYFAIFPNPTKDILTIGYPETILGIEVYSTLGQLVLSNKNSKTIDLSSLADNLYFIKIEAVDGKSIIKKVLKN